MDDLSSRQAFCDRVSRSLVKHLNRYFKRDICLEKCFLQCSKHTSKKNQIGFVLSKTMLALLSTHYCPPNDLLNGVNFCLMIQQCLNAIMKESVLWEVPVLSWKKEANGNFTVLVDKTKAFELIVKSILSPLSRSSQEVSKLSCSKRLIICHINTKKNLLADVRSLLYCSLLQKDQLGVCLSSESENDNSHYEEIAETLDLDMCLLRDDKHWPSMATKDRNIALDEIPTRFSDCFLSSENHLYPVLGSLRCKDKETAFASKISHHHKITQLHALRKAHSTGNEVPCIHVCNPKNKLLAQQTELYHAWCQDKFGQSYEGRQVDGYFCHSGVQNGTELNISTFLELRRKQIKSSFEAKLQVNLEGEEWETAFRKMMAATIKLEFFKKSSTNHMKLDLQSLPSDAMFILYNYSRLTMLLSSFSSRVKEGSYPALCLLDEVNFSSLTEDAEWELLIDHLWVFQDVITKPLIEEEGSMIKINCHLVVDYLQQLCRSVSTFYSRHHILGENLPHLIATMNARIYLMNAVKTAMCEIFNLLCVEPLQQM